MWRSDLVTEVRGGSLEEQARELRPTAEEEVDYVSRGSRPRAGHPQQWPASGKVCEGHTQGCACGLDCLTCLLAYPVS